MDIDSLYGDRASFEFEGTTVYFVSLLSTKRHVIVAKPKKNMGDIVVTHLRLPVKLVPIEFLEEAKVWDKLSLETQSEIQSQGDLKKEAIHNKMAHARGKRKRKYSDWPNEIKCKCGHVQVINKTMLAKKMDKDIGLTIEKYVATYQCQECNPTKGRGRKANPAYAHLPKELVCKCGNKVKTSGSAIVAAAKRKKITPEEYVERYECQSCSPTPRGRRKSSKNKKK